MSTLVTQSILETELGKFFVCLVRNKTEEKLTIHPVKLSNGIEVVFPAIEIDKATEDNLTAQLRELSN
jgi:hypothetical protein